MIARSIIHCDQSLQTVQLWERKLDTKALMAWNDDTLVLSFRGTASFANVLADVKACAISANSPITVCPKMNVLAYPLAWHDSCDQPNPFYPQMAQCRADGLGPFRI